MKLLYQGEEIDEFAVEVMNGEFQVEKELVNPYLWNAEQPNLYMAVLEYSFVNGEREFVPFRFGVRSIAITRQ